MNLKNRLRGFTLIEVLIVVAVVCVLTALLLSVFFSVHNAARTATCASNLQQINLALRLYVSDYKGFYPDVAGPRPDCEWAARIERYLKPTEVLECPAFEMGEYRSGCPASTFIGNPPIEQNYDGSYDIVSLRNRRPQLHEIYLRRPSSTIIVLDGDGGFVNLGNDATIDEDVLRSNGINEPRHGDGHNVLFADGHVKRLSMKALTRPSLWKTGGPQ